MKERRDSMKIIENIVVFFKKIFKKEEDIKMLETPINANEDKANFMNSLKVNIVKARKKKVETLVCEGDGLGIKKKIEC